MQKGEIKGSDIPEEDRDYYLERRYPAFGNLVPRDVASRAAKERCDAGFGVNNMPLPILFICILAIGCLADPKIFCQVDYSLILTFIGFFIFIGNLKHIPAVSSLLSSMITGHEVIVSILASQVISNVLKHSVF